ncbi:MAG: hypothetical protein AAF376_15290 [Pseudomonadota bacterium]
MLFFVKFFAHVMFPSISAFLISFALIVPEVLIWTADLPGFAILAIVMTGFMGFSIASAFASWTARRAHVSS